MDPRARPSHDRHVPVRRPRRDHAIFNAFVGVAFIGLAFAASAGAAHGPADGPAVMPARPEQASIDFSGGDVIVTGSLGHLFNASTFAGPNRAEKQGRARPAIDTLAFVRGFEEVRVHLASLRAGPMEPLLPQSQVAAVADVDPVEDEPRISVAALGTVPATAALSAIESAAPHASAPAPLMASERLAYLRADTPVTDFSVVRNASGQVVPEKELWCLATAIYFEARGENYRGQVAVAQVVMNRIGHRLYPDTICGVVFQNQHRRNACQFSFACDGIPERVTDRAAWAQAEEIAKGVAQGSLIIPEVGKATHYHATYVYPHWAPKMRKIVKIGLHVFYEFKPGWRFG